MQYFRALTVASAVLAFAGAASAQNYGGQNYGQNYGGQQYQGPPQYQQQYQQGPQYQQQYQQPPQYSDNYGPPPSYSDRTSCDRGQFGNKQVLGTVLGAAVGGLLGNQVGGGSGKTVATIAGVLGGGFLGNQVGKGMDQADQGCMAQTLDQAPPGATVTWRNPDNGYDYRVTPRDEFRRHGERCRTVESQAIIHGRPEIVTNVACRHRDGRWEFEN